MRLRTHRAANHVRKVIPDGCSNIRQFLANVLHIYILCLSYISAETKLSSAVRRLRRALISKGTGFSTSYVDTSPICRRCAGTADTDNQQTPQWHTASVNYSDCIAPACFYRRQQFVESNHALAESNRCLKLDIVSPGAKRQTRTADLALMVKKLRFELKFNIINDIRSALNYSLSGARSNQLSYSRMFQILLER